MSLLELLAWSAGSFKTYRGFVGQNLRKWAIAT